MTEIVGSSVILQEALQSYIEEKKARHDADEARKNSEARRFRIKVQGILNCPVDVVPIPVNGKIVFDKMVFVEERGQVSIEHICAKCQNVHRIPTKTQADLGRYLDGTELVCASETFELDNRTELDLLKAILMELQSPNFHGPTT